MSRNLVRIAGHAFVLNLLALCTYAHAGDREDPHQGRGPGPMAPLACDNSIKARFRPDANTEVILVKTFKKGAPLLLTGTASASTPLAQNDLCVVKLNVGPGNPGPAGAPSTSPGIGIEIWLPSPRNWNSRIHVQGGGGWAGGVHGRTDALAGVSASSLGSVADTAGIEGAVSATNDTGHSAQDGSFAMNPDGTINIALWKDFAERAIHEMAVKTKALARAYYGRNARYSYWDGFSTGGRQGLKEAQVNPDDFDGILAGAPAINWTKFITTELYPQIVMQRDLAGTRLTPAQLDLVSVAAVNACDMVGDQHLGYVPDPTQCHYDPAVDKDVLCKASGGVNATSACVSPAQALAINKMWYGQTDDGSVPSPALDNGTGEQPTGQQRWYGVTRGTSLQALAGASPFPIASDLVALELQDASYATPAFKNATANGQDRWQTLSYAGLSNAWERGLALQGAFSNINTDNPDLGALRDKGGKLLLYHGTADVVIPPQGSVNYYNRVARSMGGMRAIQRFTRFYLVPGMSHGFASGSAKPGANPPLPTAAQLYATLTDWVEKGIAPGRIDIVSPGAAPHSSRPLCPYPREATFASGDPLAASSYVCR